MYQRALAIREKVLAEDHPRLLESYRDLADLLGSVGQPEQAIPFYERALAMSARILGSGHDDTRALASKLATVYESVGRGDDAEGILRDQQ